jgi:hypothetical protein
VGSQSHSAKVDHQLEASLGRPDDCGSGKEGRHMGGCWVLEVDIEDFFGSTGYGSGIAWPLPPTNRHSSACGARCAARHAPPDSLASASFPTLGPPNGKRPERPRTQPPGLAPFG